MYGGLLTPSQCTLCIFEKMMTILESEFEACSVISAVLVTLTVLSYQGDIGVAFKVLQACQKCLVSASIRDGNRKSFIICVKL